MSKTRYSEKIDGDRGNFDWQVSFDDNGGYLGVNQYDGEALNARILLSPAQVQGLLDFVGKKKTSRAA